MNKKVTIALIVIVLAGGGLYVYGKSMKKAQAPTETNQVSDSTDGQSQQTMTPPAPTPATTATPPSAAKTPTPAPTPAPSKATFSSGEEPVAPDIQVVEVSYDGKAFSPSSVTIKAGDYVIFRNNGNSDFWPASAPHPSHTDYPEFDAKKGIAPGGKYQFQFSKTGTWKYHDHLNPTAYGSVTVK